MSLHLKEMSKGQSFWECAYGQCIEGKLLETPKSVPVTIGGKEHTQWHCKADYKGREVDLIVTEGMEHYGPKLYPEPAYQSRKDILENVTELPRSEKGQPV